MAEQKKQDTNQLLKVRREKLADLQANGKDPFQITKFDQTHRSLEVKVLMKHRQEKSSRRTMKKEEKSWMRARSTLRSPAV